MVMIIKGLLKMGIGLLTGPNNNRFFFNSKYRNI